MCLAVALDKGLPHDKHPLTQVLFGIVFLSPVLQATI